MLHEVRQLNDEIILRCGLDEAIKGDFTGFKELVIQVHGLAMIVVPIDRIGIFQFGAVNNTLRPGNIHAIVLEVHAVKKNDRLTIEVSTTQEFTLEAGLFEENVDFFEDMFDIEPVLKVKRIV